MEPREPVSRLVHQYEVGAPCYALYCGPRRNRQPRWVPAVVTKAFGTRTVSVQVYPRGPTWRRHIDQLQPRYGVDQDTDPGEVPTEIGHVKDAGVRLAQEPVRKRNSRLPTPTDSNYGPQNPRRSEWLQRKQIATRENLASGNPQLVGRCCGPCPK